MSVEIKTIDGFKDHRANRFFDVYPDLDGQITVSVVEPNQFSGWHKHQLQYDIFFVAVGSLKLGIIAPDAKVTEVFLSSEDSKTVYIPSNYWHCYKSTDQTAVLIYYLSQKHNKNDEFRASEEEIFDQYGYKI